MPLVAGVGNFSRKRWKVVLVCVNSNKICRGIYLQEDQCRITTRYNFSVSFIGTQLAKLVDVDVDGVW